MGRQRVQTRADQDTVDAIEEYREDNDLSNAEAVRRLLRAGLVTKGYQIKEVTRLNSATNNRTEEIGKAVVFLLLLGTFVSEVGLI